MLFYTVLYTINFVNVFKVNCFLIHESYRVRLEDNSNYKIEESFHEDDYELIDREDLVNFRIEDKDIELYQLKKLADKEFKKDMNTKGLVREWFKGTEPTDPVTTDEDEEIVTEFMKPLTQYAHYKREITNNTDKESSDYDYKSLIEDYYEEEIEESKSNKSFHATTVGTPENEFVHAVEQIVDFNSKAKNCTVEETQRIGIEYPKTSSYCLSTLLKGSLVQPSGLGCKLMCYRLKALKCIYKDFKMGNQPPRILATKLMRIMKIWFFVYLAVAVPLWCSRGWCCCCLFCRFFKPRTTIEEAKRYLVINPPGVLRNRLGTETQYEPTEYEIESYDKFEHTIRTI